jgi:hypothetical protein
MQKNFLAFVEPLPGTQTLNYSGLDPIQQMHMAITGDCYNKSKLISDTPDPTASSATLKASMDTLYGLYQKVPSEATSTAVKNLIFNKYSLYKVAYDEALQRESTPVASPIGAGAVDNTPSAPGSGAADPGTSTSVTSTGKPTTTETATSTAATNASATSSAPHKKLVKYALIGGGILLAVGVVYLVAKKK